MGAWWEMASETERLAQIDGGISLGMSARQVAANCGFDLLGNDHLRVRQYAAMRGRHFVTQYHTPRMKAASKQSHNARRRRAGVAETQAYDAFELFGAERQERLFDRSQND